MDEFPRQKTKPAESSMRFELDADWRFWFEGKDSGYCVQWPKKKRGKKPGFRLLFMNFYRELGLDFYDETVARIRGRKFRIGRLRGAVTLPSAREATADGIVKSGEARLGDFRLVLDGGSIRLNERIAATVHIRPAGRSGVLRLQGRIYDVLFRHVADRSFVCLLCFLFIIWQEYAVRSGRG